MRNFLMCCIAIGLLTGCSNDIDRIDTENEIVMKQIKFAVTTPEIDVEPMLTKSSTLSDIKGYVFEKESQKLVVEKVIASDANGVFAVSLPIGKAYTVLFVGNGEEAVSFATENPVMSNCYISTGDNLQKDIFLSDTLSFLVKGGNVEVEPLAVQLRRAVGAINYTPTESASELAAIAVFDETKMQLTNARNRISFDLKTSASTVDVFMKADKGYAGTFYLFPSAQNEMCEVDMFYRKSGVEITDAMWNMGEYTIERNRRWMLKGSLLNKNIQFPTSGSITVPGQIEEGDDVEIGNPR